MAKLASDPCSTQLLQTRPLTNHTHRSVGFHPILNLTLRTRNTEVPHRMLGSLLLVAKRRSLVNLTPRVVSLTGISYSRRRRAALKHGDAL